MRKKTKIKQLKDELEELWKLICLKRDNFTCQYCGNKKDLQVHHIISRSNMNTKFDIENGITLCKKCHTKISVNPSSRTEFMIWYIKKFGIEKLEELQKRAREIKRWNIKELEELIEDFKNKFNSFIKEGV